jgi:hypothetical protein
LETQFPAGKNPLYPVVNSNWIYQSLHKLTQSTFKQLMQSGLYILYETASGYALFERLEADEVALQLDQVQGSITDLGKFGKLIRLKSFAPFKSAAHALENIMDVSEGLLIIE